MNLEEYENSTKDDDNTERSRKQRLYSASAPASTNSLLGNFEVSIVKAVFLKRSKNNWKKNSYNLKDFP